MEAMLDAELEGQNDFDDDYDDLRDEVDSAGGSPPISRGAAATAADVPDVAAGPAEASAAPRSDVAIAASGDGGQGSIGPMPLGAGPAAAVVAAAAGSVVRSPALEGPGDSSTVMCADMHGDVAEEHVSAAPGLFSADGVMRWGKKRKR